MYGDGDGSEASILLKAQIVLKLKVDYGAVSWKKGKYLTRQLIQPPPRVIKGTQILCALT
jgi:hypothetical protein